MSQRERQSARAGTARPANGPGPPRPPSTSPADRPGAWEEFFRSASPDQQAELLAQARRQEILYTHQLRHTSNGAASERAGQILNLLRSGKASCLEAVRPALLAPVDAALDDVQRDAVGKAMATPDLCLIQGLPGTGKSRVVAELVTQAALRGERILLVAPTPEAIDRVLEQVADREAIFPVRCLGREERGEDLVPALQSLTFERRLRHLSDHAIPEARREVEALAQSSQKLAHSEAVLGRCLELADAVRKLTVDVTAAEKELAEAPAAIDGEVRRLEAGDGSASPLTEPFQVRSRAFAQIDAALADFRRRADECRQQLEQQAPQRLTLSPLVDAKRNGRWWTASWWRAKFAGDVLVKWEAIESVSRRLEDERGGIERNTQRLSQERDQAEQAYQAERQRHVTFEVARRQAVLDERLSALRTESAVVAEKWQRAIHELEPTTRPTFGNADQVRALQEECRRQQEALSGRAGLTREWLECLTAQAGHFPIWLAGRANLVAATNLTLATDPHFGDAINFDLLVAEEAHRLTEAEFVQLGRRARRWVLVGETERGEPCGPDPAEARKTRPAAGLRLPPPRLFAELWRQLHCDPRRLPCAWLQEDARLCCRLRDLSAEDRRWLETEHVADFPEIELRILALPRQKPLLAEVVFPPSMSVVQAKEYIFRELQELPVRALGHSYRWFEDPERLVLRLSDAPVSKPLAVALENGVREMVGQAGPETNGARPGHTCCLEFDRSAGWDQARAEDWVQRHLGVRDPGRTVRLDVPHRMQDPVLAAFVSELLYAGGYRPVKAAANGAAGENGHSAPVEFVSVPSAAADLAPRKAENGKRNAGVSRPRATRSGAGLELDMAEPSHRSRLPADLRNGMPDRGIVNLLEAQAVVRYLEGLAAAGSTATVGVMALYPAQVALIRTLVRQSTRLGGLDLRVGEPSAFRERECGVVLLSLTRSHQHRAVTYGEGPQLLGLALTRARRKLVLFGDPGTLARRREWDGPVDHLDDGAAAWERDLVARLLRQLDGAAARPAAPILEGSHA